MCAHDPKVVVLKVNVTGIESKKVEKWVCKGKNMHARGLATKKELNISMKVQQSLLKLGDTLLRKSSRQR